MKSRTTLTALVCIVVAALAGSATAFAALAAAILGECGADAEAVRDRRQFKRGRGEKRRRHSAGRQSPREA